MVNKTITNIIKSVCLALLFLFSLQNTHSQTQKLKFDHFNFLNTVPIRCIYQDQTGFIWIGTREGLHRYDGNEFLAFRPEFEDPSEQVADLCAEQRVAVVGFSLRELAGEDDSVAWECSRIVSSAIPNSTSLLTASLAKRSTS